MGTVSKALSLLTLFTHARPEIGLSEITRLSGLNKATAYRLLRELQGQGFVEQVGADRSYRLGSEVLRLAALREATVPILTVSNAVLNRVCEETGETAHVSLIQGDRLVTLTHQYSPRHATRVMMDDAEILSFHATGSGLAILSFAPDEFLETILAKPLEALTEKTETDPDRVRAIVSKVRQTGIAESVGGFEVDVHSHATPVFGADQYPIGALAVAAPVSRMTPELAANIRAAVRSGSQELTRKLGGFFPADFPAAAAT